jgi:hypothetical protein
MSITSEQNTNFEITQGDTFNLQLTYYDEMQNPIDITGYTVVMEIRDKPGSRVLSAQCSIGDGIIISDAVNGVISIEVSSVKTKVIPYPKAVYQIQVTDQNGSKTTLVQGWFTVNPGVIQ